METLKRGSKGEDVKMLQRALSHAGMDVTVDGDFGAKTEKAVKEFQKSKGLTADGIVGQRTWDALPDSIVKSADPSVVYSPLSVHITKSPDREIKYIAIHYTAGTTSKKGSAMKVKGVFQDRKASADFCVDDETMVQLNPDVRNYYCWAVGDKKYAYSKGGSLYGKATNRNTVSIEMCSNLRKGFTNKYDNNEGWYISEETLRMCVRLTRILMKKYGVPAERVVRHYDITGKTCPGVVGWNDETIYTSDDKPSKRRSTSTKWDEFKSMIRN